MLVNEDVEIVNVNVNLYVHGVIDSWIWWIVLEKVNELCFLVVIVIFRVRMRMSRRMSEIVLDHYNRVCDERGIVGLVVRILNGGDGGEGGGFDRIAVLRVDIGDVHRGDKVVGWEFDIRRVEVE